LDRIVVVGLSLAGLRAVEAFRRLGFAGEIVAVDPEPHDPYDRPPLSKEVLRGDWEPAQAALRRQGLDDLGIRRVRAAATGLDLDGREVHLDTGERLVYGGLLVATGAAPRRLATQPDLDGVFALRTLDDALAIRAWLESEPARVVVIGAGFIGSEVAASCRARGLPVTVLEALPQPMVRGLGPALGEICGELHRDHGVDLRVAVSVESIEGDDRVERVRLADGDVVAADVVVVGVGVSPVTGWLEGSGLAVADGIVADETLRAAPGVVVAGDVCRWPNPRFDGALMRLEHWTNAAEQGMYAAERLLREADGERVEPFAPVPFVWSDQYDVKIQSAGWFSGDDEMEIVAGSLEDRRFVALFGRDGRLTGVLGFSEPRLVMQYRRMIAEHASWDEARAAGS
jgi:3-phenylpropionate/trans-cinnamate dioxygenase ferredoxin reductase subunit